MGVETGNQCFCDTEKNPTYTEGKPSQRPCLVVHAAAADPCSLCAVGAVCVCVFVGGVWWSGAPPSVVPCHAAAAALCCCFGMPWASSCCLPMPTLQRGGGGDAAC